MELMTIEIVLVAAGMDKGPSVKVCACHEVVSLADVILGLGIC